MHRDLRVHSKAVISECNREFRMHRHVQFVGLLLTVFVAHMLIPLGAADVQAETSAHRVAAELDPTEDLLPQPPQEICRWCTKTVFPKYRGLQKGAD
eukprot:779575-Rhodomonas_salina.1